jgi:hypothetical protein
MEILYSCIATRATINIFELVILILSLLCFGGEIAFIIINGDINKRLIIALIMFIYLIFSCGFHLEETRIVSRDYVVFNSSESLAAAYDEYDNVVEVDNGVWIVERVLETK